MRLSASIPLLFAAALGGCASGGAEMGAGRGAWAARERGHDLAQRQCAGCHALTGPIGPTGAPPFAELGRRYNALTFERKLQDIARGRHDLMPAFQLTKDEAADLSAYFSAQALQPAPCQPAVEKTSCSQ